MSTETEGIRYYLEHDRDLDYRFETSLDLQRATALRQLANREYQGNIAAAIRDFVTAALKQRYLLSE